jgi:hypothetical protein
MMAVQVVTPLPTATTADGPLDDTISLTALLPPPAGATFFFPQRPCDLVAMRGLAPHLSTRPVRQGGLFFRSSLVPAGSLPPCGPTTLRPWLASVCHRVVAGAGGGALVPLIPTAAPDATQAGMAFRSASVLEILKPPTALSHANWLTGNATSWAPTPNTPPAPTTRRSIWRLSGRMSTVATLPIFLLSPP